MPSPHTSPIIWQYVVLGRTTLPPDGVEGHCRVSAPTKYKVDAKSKKGQNGGKTTLNGRDLEEIKITLVYKNGLTANGQSDQHDLVTDAVQEIKAEFEKYGSLDIACGQTDFSNTRAMTLVSIEGPEWSGGEGTITISGKRATPRPQGSVGKPLDPATAAKVAALQAYLAQLKAKIAADPNSSFTPTLQTEVTAVEAQISALRASSASVTKTPTSSAPTKQWAQHGDVPGKPSVPLDASAPKTTPV